MRNRRSGFRDDREILGVDTNAVNQEWSRGEDAKTIEQPDRRGGARLDGDPSSAQTLGETPAAFDNKIPFRLALGDVNGHRQTLGERDLCCRPKESIRDRVWRVR